MERSLLLRFTGDAPLFRMIDFLIEHKGMDFSKTDIARGAGIARASVFNHWDTMETFQIVKQTRQYGKTRLYTLDTGSQVTRRLLELERTLIARKIHAKKEAAAH